MSKKEKRTVDMEKFKKWVNEGVFASKEMQEQARLSFDDGSPILKEMEEMEDIVFMPYPSLEDEGKKETCLFCHCTSTMKVVGGKAAIRCCDKKECQDLAIKYAEIIEKTKKLK